VTMTESESYTQINCLGQGPYNVTTTTVTATLAAISSVNVTVRVNGTINYCYGTSGIQTYDITITAGSLSNYVDIITSSYVDCGQGSCVIETITIDGYESQTPNYGICGAATPTITPTSTSTSQVVYTYNCNNGSCEIVEGEGGLYTTLEACQASCQSITYYCRENEFSPCIAQVGPCTGNQIVCTEFEQPN
jgi:hypothetical protein